MPDRSTVLRAQTPQAFRLTIIRKAFENALTQGNIGATDDVGIVHRYMPETAIFIVPGEETNKKITYIQDLR
jgi:2-C-methyl-D-erythritol 4-phosphate cytidylyltransferase